MGNIWNSNVQGMYIKYRGCAGTYEDAMQGSGVCKTEGTLLGTPNREPQEYSRNIMEYKDPGRYIPIIYLLYSWGSLFGVPSRVPLKISGRACLGTTRPQLPR